MNRTPKPSETLGLFARIFSLDLRSIALFRVLLGTLILLDLALRSVDLRAFYTDGGVLSRSHLLGLSNRWYWSFHSANGELWWQIVLFSTAALAALALVVGYRSRLSAFISFVLLVSLLNRNGLVLQGGDQLLVIMCFWSLFLPLGARYSIDAALIPDYQKNPNKIVSSTLFDNAYFSLATVAIVFQVLYLYIFTAILKTGDAWLVRFDAAFYAVSLQQFATPIGDWIKQFPTLLNLSTRYVLLVEFIAPLLVLCPFFWPWLRMTGLLLLASLHAAFLLMLHIGLFPLIDFMALSLLIPGTIWVYLNKADCKTSAKARKSIHIYYDEDCGFCLKMCLILRALLLPSTTPISPAQQHPDIYQIMEQHNSWVVTDRSGQAQVHWHAMVILFQERWLLKPIAWLMSLPPFIQLGNALYRAIANNRPLMGKLSSTWLPFRTVSTRPTIAGSLLAAFMFYIITSYNVYGLPQIKQTTPKHVDIIAKSTRTNQRWDMFAPYPLTTSMYVTIPGKLRNGESVNLYPSTSLDPAWVAPDRYHGLFEGYRWRKYYGRVNSHKNNKVRSALGSYLCNSWNTSSRPTEQQLATLEIHIVKHRTNTENKPKAKSSRRVWRHWCYAEFADKK